MRVGPFFACRQRAGLPPHRERTTWLQALRVTVPLAGGWRLVVSVLDYHASYDGSRKGFTPLHVFFVK